MKNTTKFLRSFTNTTYLPGASDTAGGEGGEELSERKKELRPTG